MATLDNAEQFSKALFPIVSKSAPRLIVLKLVQLWKARAPIDKSPSGSVTCESAEQYSKVYAPNVVTPSGIVTDVRFSLPSKAPSAKYSAPFSIVCSELGNDKLNKLQRLNAPYPIVVTPSGIVTDVSLVHDENTLRGMLVRPLGRVTDARFVQPENTDSPKEVTE